MGSDVGIGEWQTFVCRFSPWSACWGRSLLRGSPSESLLPPLPSSFPLSPSSLPSPCHLARVLAPGMPCVLADSLINSRLCRRLRGLAGHTLPQRPLHPPPGQCVTAPLSARVDSIEEVGRHHLWEGGGACVRLPLGSVCLVCLLFVSMVMN